MITTGESTGVKCCGFKGPSSTVVAMWWAVLYMKSDLIPSINFPFQTFQPVLDGYRNKCEFTIAEGPDGGRILIRHAHSANLAPDENS